MKKILVLCMTGILTVSMMQNPVWATEKVEATTEQATTEQATGTGMTIDCTISGPNSSTDCSKQLQQAFDAAKKYGTDADPYVVYIKAGTYKIGETLNIYSNTYVEMDAGTIIYRNFGSDADCACMLRSGNSYDVSSGYDGYRNITFKGGVWDGNGANARDDHFSIMRFGHATNITMNNLTMKNEKGAHSIEFGGVKGITITNCTFQDQLDAGVGTAKEAIEFDVTYAASNFSSFPGYDDTPCVDILISGCAFRNVQRGLGTHSSSLGVYYTNVKILNNTFTNIKEMAVNAQAFKSSAISGNTMTNVGQGIRFNYMSEEGQYYFVPAKLDVAKINPNAATVIENNTISVKQYGDGKAVQPFGIRTMGYRVTSTSKNYTKYKIPVMNYSVKNVKIRSNAITIQGNGHGIRLIDTYYSTVEGNTINYKTHTADKQYSGISLAEASGNNTLTGNTIYYAKNYGIGLAGKCNSNTIQKNKIYSALQCGIHLSSQCNSDIIQNNTISKTKGNGIGISDHCTGTVVANNVVSSGTAHGISIITKSTAKVKSNTFSGNARNGINVSDRSKVTVQGNKVTGNIENGIAILGTSNGCVVDKNVVEKNRGNGISIFDYSKKCTVTGNTVRNNKKSGLAVLPNADAVLKNNTTYGNVDAQIFVGGNGKCNVPTLDKLTISSVRRSAVKVKGTGNYGLSVTVYTGTKKAGTTKVSTGKQYSVKIKKQKVGTVIKASGKDKGGNVTVATTKVVK